MVDVVDTECGTLWIVATPIGTLGDFSSRAGQVLERVAIVLAEDTRRTRRLLTGLELTIHGRLRSFHEHNETGLVPEVLECLKDGADVAIVSDAGTPVLSDPGFELIRRVREEGVSVASVPGPSAFSAALAASGQPPLPAVLVGFLPPKKGQRRRRLAEPLMAQATTVIFLSPHRLAAEIMDAAEVLGAGRPATLMAELSKKHERAEVGTLGCLAVGREVQNPRGEYVLVIGPPSAEMQPSGSPSALDAREAYRAALKLTGERREAMRTAAREMGLGRRAFYALLLENEDL